MKISREENPVRRLRKALGLGQPDFGKLIGRSHQSVQAYETHGDIPNEVIDRLKTIAAEKGFAHLALELSSDDWRVRTLLHPPQDFATRQAGPIPAEPARQQWHAYLDALLDAGDPDLISAIQLLLRHSAAPARKAGQSRSKG